MKHGSNLSDNFPQSRVSSQCKSTARRHAAYFAGFLKATAAGASAFDGRNGAASDLHIGNVRKALAWSFSSSGDCSIGIELAAHATPLFLAVSLFAECQQWCERALAALQEADRGSRRELELQQALAMSSMYTLGKINEVNAAIARGLELAESLRDDRSQLNLFADLNVLLTRRGDFNGTLEVAKRNAALAERTGGAREKVLAEWMLGTSYHLAGDQAAALRHCELGFELASAIAPAQFDLFYETRARFSLARALWLRGFPDRGREVALETIRETARYSHHFSYCAVLVHSTPVLLWSGDYASAAGLIELAITQAAKYSLRTFHTLGLALKGELKLAGGELSSGIEILRGALNAMIAERYNVVRSATSRALAEGLVRSGRTEEALATIDEAVTFAEEVNELLWLPDLLRARGEILLAFPQPDLVSAQDSLLRSIDLARKQFALSWELRATIPLARMWGNQGRTDEARLMPEAIFQRFTEGFGTPDLVAARHLLDELGTN